jgi:hypothetical protein
MKIEIESIGCYQLKGEEVVCGDEVVFTGEYMPTFMSNTPENCPLRLKTPQNVSDFVACLSCKHVIVNYNTRTD